MASIPVGSSPARGSSRINTSGACNKAAASCTRCWFPCDKASTLASRRSARAEPLHPARHGGPGVAGTHAVQPAQVLELLVDVHARIEPPFLGHVAEAASLRLADG